ncbi:MAG: type II toxin-antitoxin system VapC family toxin [Acidobacteriota bacterium]
MNFYFLDSSSFIKLLLSEKGSSALRQTLHAVPESQQTLSVLARVEVNSALARKVREGEITSDEAATYQNKFQSSCVDRILWEIDEPVVNLAIDLLHRYALRSLDALQLSAVLLFRRYLSPTDTLLFIASDARLLAAATTESLSVWDPSVVP